MKNIGMNIRKFFWHVEETNEKKRHLVKEEIVRGFQSNHRMGIKDPKLMNMTMGAKILWMWRSGGTLPFIWNILGKQESDVSIVFVQDLYIFNQISFVMGSR